MSTLPNLSLSRLLRYWPQSGVSLVLSAGVFAFAAMALINSQPDHQLTGPWLLCRSTRVLRYHRIGTAAGFIKVASASRLKILQKTKDIKDGTSTSCIQEDDSKRSAIIVLTSGNPPTQYDNVLDYEFLVTPAASLMRALHDAYKALNPVRIKHRDWPSWPVLTQRSKNYRKERSHLAIHGISSRFLGTLVSTTPSPMM